MPTPMRRARQPELRRASRGSVPPILRAATRAAIISAISGAGCRRAGDRRGLVARMAGQQAAAAGRAPVNTAAIDALAARIAGVEVQDQQGAAAPAPDPAAAARVDALEKSLAALRGELAAARAQSEKLAAAVNDIKSAPRETPPRRPDLSPINDRIAQIEARHARPDRRDRAGNAASRADDVPLRRVVAAALLDVSVRQRRSLCRGAGRGEIARRRMPDALKPLEVSRRRACRAPPR